MSSPNAVKIMTTVRSDGSLLNCKPNHEFSPDPPSPCQLYMFSHHRDRMLAAAKAFKWPDAIEALEGPQGLVNLESAVAEYLSVTYHDSTFPRPVRVKIMISEDSELEMESTETAPRSFHALYPDSFIAEPPKGSNEWKIQLSSTLITASPYTQHKTTKREVYDTARAHLPTGDIFTEILLQNTHGEVMEGTLSTPYFLRRGKWITPAQKCGGNRGTTRRWALEKGYCVEGVIRAEDLQDGEVIWLSTGNRGFGWGYLSLRKGNRKLEPQAEVFELA